MSPRYYPVVEAGLGTAPPADPAVWYRLSGEDRNVLRGYVGTRTSQNVSTGEAEPGVATVVLLGDNGWLDPTNTLPLDALGPLAKNPYKGLLVPGCPLRVRNTDGAGNYWPEWRGFVKKWPRSQDFRTGQDAVIECYDGLGWLGSIPPPYPSDLHRAILATGPTSYWPHDDAQGTTVRDVVGGFDAALAGAAAIGGPSLTPDGAGGSGVFSNLVTDYAAASPNAFPPVAPWTIQFLVRVFANAGTDLMYFMTGPPGPSTGPPDSVNMGPNYCDIASGGSGLLNHLAAVGIVGPGLYLVAFGGSSANTITWKNGVTVENFARSAGTYPAPNRVAWGAALNTASASTALGVQISHVAIWNRIITTAEHAAMWSAASVARSGDFTSYRLNYLLDLVGWPTGMRDFIGGIMQHGPVRLGAAYSNMLDVVRDVVQYEAGLLACDASGKFVFRGRYSDPASTFTIGGERAPTQAPVYSTNDTTVITSASVSEPPVLYNAGTNIVNGRTATMKELAYTPDDAFEVARRAVQLGGSPRPGVDTVTLDPVGAPAALTMDLTDVGTIARRPNWSPVDIVEAQQVTSVTTTAGAGKPLKRAFSMLQPRLTQWRLNCTGAASTGATTPYLSRFNPSAAIVVEVLFRLSAWTGANNVLIAHDDPDSGFGWKLYTDATGAMYWVWADNAGARRQAFSTPINRTGIRYVWGKVVFTPSTGVTNFYISTSNRSSYVAWGTSTFGATTVRASSTPIRIGTQPPGTASLTGDVLAAYAQTVAGVPIVSFDPTADNQSGASSWTSSTGEVWSLVGTGALYAS